MVLPNSFRVYKKKVTVNINGVDEEFELLPLSGEFYGDFMDVMRTMPTGSENSESDFMSKFTPEMTSKIHRLLMQMFKESLNIVDDKDIIDLDKTISKNFISLIPVLATVNLPDNDEVVDEVKNG